MPRDYKISPLFEGGLLPPTTSGGSKTRAADDHDKHFLWLLSRLDEHGKENRRSTVYATTPHIRRWVRHQKDERRLVQPFALLRSFLSNSRFLTCNISIRTWGESSQTIMMPVTCQNSGDDARRIPLLPCQRFSSKRGLDGWHLP